MCEALCEGRGTCVQSCGFGRHGIFIATCVCACVLVGGTCVYVGLLMCKCLYEHDWAQVVCACMCTTLTKGKEVRGAIL